MRDFFSFMHPNEGCRCCHEGLHSQHPSVDCSCCQVEWEKTDRSLSLEAFVRSKNASIAAAIPLKKTASKRETVVDFNVSIKNPFHSNEMENLLFCGEAVTASNAATMAEILTDLGLFPSRGAARRAGWEGQIPPGFSQHRIGKKKTLLTIWNPVEVAEV